MFWKISRSSAKFAHTEVIAHSINHLQVHYGKSFAGHKIYTQRGRYVGQFLLSGIFEPA